MDRNIHDYPTQRQIDIYIYIQQIYSKIGRKMDRNIHDYPSARQINIEIYIQQIDRYISSRQIDKYPIDRKEEIQSDLSKD